MHFLSYYSFGKYRDSYGVSIDKIRDDNSVILLTNADFLAYHPSTSQVQSSEDFLYAQFYIWSNQLFLYNIIISVGTKELLDS